MGKSTLFSNQTIRQTKTGGTFGMWYFLLFVAVAGIVGAVVSIFSQPKIIVVSSPSPSQSPSSPSTLSSFLPPVPFSVPTRCWGGSCGNRGIDMNLGIRPTGDIFNDPYIPPVKNETTIYRQMGILKANDGSQLILPLMGRRHIDGRQKYNYYTISNTGALNTKLPIRVKGRVCSSEYGCDEIFSGDVVFVEGYDIEFKVNVYENNQYSYYDQTAF